MSEEKKKRPSGHAALKAAGKVPVMLGLDPAIAAKIDERRGVVPRATWITEMIRQAVLSAESFALRK